MVDNDQSALNKSQKLIILAVTFGNILEWYDIYLYVYWAPTISKLFFKPNSDAENLFNAIAIFSLGFIFRPLGGLFFGHMGDRFGRKKIFLLTILLMTIPTFVLGLMPVYAQIGIFAPFLLAFIRILQTFPSGGELPGVFCYLYENANPQNRKLMTSFAGVGNQIGILLSALECFLMEAIFPVDFLKEWGWRISFILGGFIGVGCCFLRYKLHETISFHEIAMHHKLSNKSITEVIKGSWKKIITGISYGAVQTSSFHLVSILFPVYVYKAIGITGNTNTFISSVILITLMTLPLPIYGFLADKFGAKIFLIGSCIGILCLLFPLYSALHTANTWRVLGIMATYVLCVTCITALWPYLVSHLFPTSERYTCTGLSFNISDGFFGGLSTVIGLYILKTTGNSGNFIWIISISCIISLISYIRIKE